MFHICTSKKSALDFAIEESWSHLEKQMQGMLEGTSWLIQDCKYGGDTPAPWTLNNISP